jgi:hypothetical protein
MRANILLNGRPRPRPRSIKIKILYRRQFFTHEKPPSFLAGWWKQL